MGLVEFVGFCSLSFAFLCAYDFFAPLEEFNPPQPIRFLLASTAFIGCIGSVGYTIGMFLIYLLGLKG
jgi:hypothetical protein